MARQDRLTTEYFKIGENACLEWLRGELNVSLNAKPVSIDWGVACLVQLYKKATPGSE